MEENISRRSVLASVAASPTLGLFSSGSRAVEPEVVGESSGGAADSSMGIAWNETLSAGEGSFGSELVRNDGGYLLAGGIHKGLDDADQDGFLRRTALDGSTSWQTRYQRSGGWGISGVTPVTGGYVAIANRKDAQAAALLWYDLFGNLVNEEIIEEDQNDRIDDITTVGTDVIAVGRRSTGEHAYDNWLLKYDATGSSEWEKSHYGEIYQAELNTVAPAANGDIWALGRVKHETAGKINVSISRVAEDGSLVSGKELSIGDRADYAHEVLSLSKGGFFASGTTRTSGSNWTAWAGKFDETGDNIWLWRNENGVWNVADGCLRQADGSFLLVGDHSRTRNAWWAVLEEDGTLRWQEEHTSYDPEVFGAVASAPGGATAGGSSRSRSENDYPVAWMAGLSPEAETTDIGFDPRTHGFGFSNWAGSTGIAADDSEFTLPYDQPSMQDVKDAVFGVASPLHKPFESWEDGTKALQAEYIEYSSQAGHCLGMVSAAHHYYHVPEHLPAAAPTASDVPHPTGTYHSVGERIRENQSIFSHGINGVLSQFLQSIPGTDPETGLHEIIDSIERTDTAPIRLTLAPEDADDHAVLAYDYEVEDGMAHLYVYDPNDTPESYFSPNEQVDAELGEEKSDEDQAFENPRNVISADIGDESLVDSTYELSTFQYFPIDRVTGVDQSDGDSDQVEAVMDTLRMPAPESDADPSEVTPKAMSAMVVELQSTANLTVMNPADEPVRTVDSVPAGSDGGESTIAWEFGADTGDYTVEVEGESDTDYTLNVTGIDPEGGTVSTTIEDSVAAGGQHEISATLPEEGTGEIEVVNRYDPSESGSNLAVDEWGTRELAIAGGLLTLIGCGYVKYRS